MEKITLDFSKQEKELLDECIRQTKIKPTPLLRALIKLSYDEILEEIEKDQQITITIPEEMQTEKVYRLPIPVDEEIQSKCEKVKRYLPMHSATFTKIMVMQKLKNINSKKQSIEGVLA